MVDPLEGSPEQRGAEAGEVPAGDARGGPEYWSARAGARSFSHPLPTSWLAGVPREAPVLDLGCGYGRLLAELAALGFTRATGVDPAEGMIARGRDEHPGLDLRHVPTRPGEPLPFEAGSFALVLLVAVLTAVPDDADQDALLAEANRLLAPGGLLLISDLPLQNGARERARYEAGRAEHGVEGVFTLPDGGVMRHHDEARFEAFARGLEPLRRREVDTVTMNGNPCHVVQLLLRKPRAGPQASAGAGEAGAC
jgi:SAM-dependent methyltransferase